MVTKLWQIYYSGKGSRQCCHAIVLDTTDRTYTRQQPRYIEGRKNDEGKKRKGKKDTRTLTVGTIKQNKGQAQLEQTQRGVPGTFQPT